MNKKGASLRGVPPYGGTTRQSRAFNCMQGIASGFALAMTVLLFALPAHAEPVHLTILHFNDLHGHVEQAPRMATKIKEIIADNNTKGQATLILNGGDLISGTPVSARFKGKAEVIFLNYIGNEALVPGNHDFDLGLEALEKNVAAYKFPTVAANVVDKKTGKVFFTPNVIINTGHSRPRLNHSGVNSSGNLVNSRDPRVRGDDIPLKIGIFGLAHPQTPTITEPNNVVSLNFTDPIAAAKKAMRELERTTDIQIALTHEGVKNDIKLAEQVEGIDAVVGGHDHVRPNEYCRDVGNIPVCQTPPNGTYLGKIDLIFEDGKIVNSEEMLVAIDKKTKPDQELQRQLKPLLDEVNKEMGEVIGIATKKYEHYRGAKTSPLGFLITSIMKDETGANIGFLNAGGIRQGLKKGEITRGEIEEILPFPNNVVVVEISGADLQKLLDRLEKSNKSAQLSGLTGTGELEPTRLYKVATSSFLSNGGDDCEALKKARLVRNTKIYMKDMVIQYIKREQKL